MSMNLVVLTGRLTRDPELKYGASGNAYCRFTLAVNRMKKDETDFINCVAFGKTAELIGEYMRKGRMCGVQGRIQTEVYENNGEKKYTTSIVTDKIEFLESRGSGEHASFDGVSQEKTTYNKVAESKEPDLDFDDDDEFPF